MDKIKVDNFLREYQGLQFPRYISLNNKECLRISQSLQISFGLKKIIDGLRLVKEFDSLAIPLNLNADTTQDFSISKLLHSLKINANSEVYVNWYRFDKIDLLNLLDLNNFFNDLWYTNLDDIDIFDNSFEWILSINHDGYIKYLHQKAITTLPTSATSSL